jgi:hypothetical protein
LRWEPDPKFHAQALLDGLQRDGETGRKPSWFIRKVYAAYAEHAELQPLKNVDSVLKALHALLGSEHKGCWDLPGEDGIERRMIGYEIRRLDDRWQDGAHDPLICQLGCSGNARATIEQVAKPAPFNPDTPLSP